MRTKIVAGNWKMNLTLTESKQLVNKLKFSSNSENIRVLIIPPYTNLDGLKRLLDAQNSNIEIGSQNLHHLNSGAYTGEISGQMLKDIGIHIVLVGHSERRTLFNECQEVVFQKSSSALNQNFEIIYCFGEQLSERIEGIHFNVIKNQLEHLINKIDLKYWESKQIVLAYEPVWAIGTGQTATSEQAQEMHHHIRHLIQQSLGVQIANQTSILYGGSVKPSNAKELFQQPDVDGGLIGGASLDATSFNSIIKSLITQ
ncbi:MAG: triose-phosphate isomerase [Flavobacteriaceae bacterium]|nr:triose-phosphate isomerase [Flavobacteriaceae bacterium]MCY4217635.1 triose-phosphate isomerase [Flavobacteriaceae bacterium]